METHHIDLLINTLDDWSGFLATREQILEIVKSDVELINVLNKFYTDGDPTTLNNSDKDLFLDLVARYVGFSHWPLYSDEEEIADLFLIQLEQNFQLAEGYVHDPI